MLVLLVAACAFGVLEVHHSTDTWIALAAGRQILESSEFPKLDQFSYTFYGRPWINQNWLSHVLFWVLYDAFGPNAVAIGTWALGAGTFSLVLLAVWFRCRSWIAAGLAASIVAFACRDWLSARPATVQFFCLAALWAALSALLPPTPRWRWSWWPAALVLVVLGVWPHAHGSFVLGFGLLGVFVGCWAIARIIGRGTATPGRHVAGLVVVGLVVAVAGAVLSPFGIENYTHQSKVASSDVFRDVGEWAPPYVLGRQFPPVTRFWVALAVSSAVLLVAVILRLSRGASPVATRPAVNVQTVLFDLAAVGIGLGLALFARRFAPVLYILAAPALTSLTIRLAGGQPGWAVRVSRIGLGVAAWTGAVVLATRTVDLAREEMFTSFPSGRYDLLDRVTRADVIARPAFEFLRRNGLKLDVLTEWKQAGPLLFEVPGARVFIDGRAQQVYSEEHYLTYLWLLNAPPSQDVRMARLLADSRTEAVLLPKQRSSRRLIDLMDRLPGWMAVMETREAVVWVPRDGPLLAALGRRERAGELWWPDDPETALTRGLLLVSTEPPEPAQAVVWWQSAIRRQPALGRHAYAWIIKGLLQQGRPMEAAAFVREQRAALERPIGNLSSDEQKELVDVLTRCETLLKE